MSTASLIGLRQGSRMTSHGPWNRVSALLAASHADLKQGKSVGRGYRVHTVSPSAFSFALTVLSIWMSFMAFPFPGHH